MSRRQLPRGTAAQLNAATFLPGEIAVDITNDELRCDGDGSTVGGIVLARKDGVNTSVTSTGSTTARTLANRFAEVKNVKDFGATGDGVTDDYAAIAAAIAALPTRGGIVFFPPGDYAHSEVIQVGNGTSSLASTTQNIMLIGQTVPNGEISTINNATRLKYTGSAAAANIRINGPITCAIIGLALDCNFLANGGIYATHAFRSRFEDLYVGNYRGSAYKLDAYQSHAQCTTGANNNIWNNIHCAEPGTTTCTGFEIGLSAWTAGTLGVSRNFIKNFSFRCGNNANSTGILLRFCDIIQFENGLVHCGVTATSANAKLLKVLPATGNGNFPQAVGFAWVAIIGDSVTNYSLDASWIISPINDAGIMFTPFLKADVESTTNPIPDYPLLYGFTDEGEVFGKFKYRHSDLDGHRSVVSATTTAQPGSPTFEDMYIIPSGKTGAAWSTFATGSFAQYRGGQWDEIVPQEGWTAYAKDTNLELVYTGSAWVSKAPTVQVFTASGTYTKPAGVTSIVVEVRGGGGGGGGVSSGAGSLAAGGGAQGGRAVKRIAAASVGSTETVTVGTGGTGGANTGGTGGTGGTSSFGSHCSATGGGGGAGTTTAGMLTGGDGGAGSSGDINITGQAGVCGVGVTGTGPAAGAGGGEGGGRGRINTGAGIAGNDGGGGSGAASAGASTANIGGAGGDGYVIVTEFY